jgi:hypothetical protein
MHNDMIIPPKLSRAVAEAKLPKAYQRAVAALKECDSLDECKDWADKAAALASYAKQAEDPELENMARRIRARASRRCGELLKAYDGRGGDRSKNVVAPSFAPTRREAAASAGMSEGQQSTAVRLARIAEEQFEAMVESPKPPGTTIMAEIGKRPFVRRSEQADTFLDVAQMRVEGGALNVLNALLTVARSMGKCEIEDVAELLGQQTEDKREQMLAGLGFLMRLKAELAKSGAQRKPDLRPV